MLFFPAGLYQNGLCSVPGVYLSTSEVRIQVFTIDGKNLDSWNHPNMLSRKNRMGETKNGGKKAVFCA